MNSADPALQGALYWYSMGAYPKLDNLGFEQIQSLSKELVDFTGETAPYKDKKGNFPTRNILFFGKVSVIHAIAISGSILVKNQWDIEGGLELSSKSSILAPCVEAYEMYLKMKEFVNDASD